MPARSNAAKPKRTARPTARTAPAKARAAPARRTAPKAARTAKRPAKATAPKRAAPKRGPAKRPSARPSARTSPRAARKAPAPTRRTAPTRKQAKRTARRAVEPIVTRRKPGQSSGKSYRLARASERAPARPAKQLPPPRFDAKVADKPKSNLYVIDGVPTLVVADTDVKDSKVHLKLHAPGQLTLPTLQVLKLQHNFRILDQTKDSQECRFVLRGKLGGQEPAPDLVRTGAGWMASRDRMGSTTQVFRVPPGRSRLEVEVRGEVYTTDRKTGALVARSEKRADAVIELHGT